MPDAHTIDEFDDTDTIDDTADADTAAEAPDELDALDPLGSQVTLVSGVRVTVQPLRARQFFKFLRILTHGALPVLGDTALTKLDPSSDPQAFAARLISMLVLSIPDAEDETVEFIRAMVKPVGLIEPGRNKQDATRNNQLWAQLDREIDNPELDDLVTIMEAVVAREAGDIQALGKRLSGLFRLAQRTGQLKPSRRPTPSTVNSSAVSAEATTSSPTNTAGPTTRSGRSRSVGSASASPRSENDASTPNGHAANG